MPKENKLSAKDFELVTPERRRRPGRSRRAPATQVDKRRSARSDAGPKAGGRATPARSTPRTRASASSRIPERKHNAERAGLTGQLDSLLASKMPGYESFKGYLSNVMQFDPKTMELKPLRKGSQVTAGTVLGRIGKTTELAPHVHFAIRPAGRGAPKIDPKPILDGWKLLEATAIYRAAGKNPFAESSATASQVLLMSKAQLIERVLDDPSLEIYACGREDIQTGQIDRRVLAMLEYLVARGYDLTITSLKCGHSVLTTSGNVSEHSTGNAVDIAQINGIPVLGHQGPGSISEALVKDLLQLQGTMKPHQIISPDGLLRRRQHLRDGRPRRPRPRRLHAGRRARLRQHLEAVLGDAEARPVAAPDRPPRRDRQPDGADQALRRGAPGAEGPTSTATRASAAHLSE